MSGTPYGLLGTPMLGQQQQPGAGLGSLYNAVNGQMQGPGGVWGGPTLSSAVAPPAMQPLQTGLPGVQWNAAPGVTWNGPGGAPAPAPAPMPTYDQWGRPQGGTAAPAAVPNMNTGPGLPVQPQQGSGYNQWGQQTPPSPAAVALAQQAMQRQAPLTPADILSMATGIPTQQQAMQNWDPATYGQPGDRGAWNRVQGLLGNAVGGGGSPDGGGAGGDRGPSQGNQGQQDAATAAGGQAASGDKGPSVGGGSAASGHDSDEEGPF